jgi:tight adherence protein B
MIGLDGSQIAVAVLAALSAGCVAYALIYPYLSGDIRGEKRRKAAAKPTTRRVTGADRGIDALARRKQVGDSLKELEARQKERSRLSLEARIAQAGLDWSRQRFYVISAVMAVVLGLVFLVTSGNKYMGLFGLIIGGAGLPKWLLSFLRKRRIKKFLDAFPDAMDVIVRGIKSGLPLGDCLRIIASEGREPVKSEFRLICETQTLGISVGDACARLYERIPVPEANFFGIVILIQQKAGGNLSEAIGNLSRVLRERKKMKGKVDAMSMEAKASAAIIASLPFIVAILVYLSSPHYIDLLWLKQMGIIVMLASGFWMLCGVLVMRKMINFDM